MTRAKMICREVKETSVGADGSQFDVEFFPVTGGSDENEKFYKYTPAGGLNLNGLKSHFGFEVGREYYIDVTPAAQEMPAPKARPINLKDRPVG